jgi:hypothetical protein
MNYTFKISVPFWTDIDNIEKSTRVRNVQFVAVELQKLVTYLRGRGIDIDFTIYDFSPEPVIEGAVHKSFPLGAFRKSEKWNFILEQTNTDYFIGLDSDMFIHEEDYEKFYNLLCVPNNEHMMLFNTRCVQDWDTDKVDWKGHDTSNLPGLNLHMYCSYGHVGSFGGLWICPTHFLKEAGGFNENIKFRGDEDGEMYTRIIRTNIEREKYVKRILDIIPIHLPHVYHMGDPLYQNKNEHNGEWQPRTEW